MYIGARTISCHFNLCSGVRNRKNKIIQSCTIVSVIFKYWKNMIDSNNTINQNNIRINSKSINAFTIYKHCLLR